MFQGISPDQLSNWIKDPRWREEPVDIETFVNGKEYLNIRNEVYRFILKILKIIFGSEPKKGPKYRDVTILAGIGSGKSYIAQIALPYMTHWLMCHRDPHEFFKVTKDKPITIGNAGPNAQQCKKVVFKGYRSFMFNSEWFKNRIPEKNFQQTNINIGNYGIEMRSGNSTAEYFIGSNILVAAIDEASFHLQTSEVDAAEELYTGLDRRRASRFGINGMILAISSPRSISDFTVRRFEDVKSANRLIYEDKEKLVEIWEKDNGDGTMSLAVRAPTWACKDREKMDDGDFEFKLNDNQILKIPIQFKSAFEKNPEKALLDFAALPKAASRSVFSMPHLITEHANRDREDPLDIKGDLRPEFRPKPGALYYGHIDLSYRKDKAAFVIARKIGPPPQQDYLPQVRIELIKTWDPSDYPGSELPISVVRNFVLSLKSMGFLFKKITLDQFQSRDTIQILNNKGIKTELLSIDKNPKIVDSFKEAIYTKTLDYYQHDALFKELKELQDINGKFDHPFGGSKDIADAACGAHWNAILDNKKEAKFDSWEL